MGKELFRKKSLENVSSPEKLDEYVRVTNPGVWSVLIACIAILVAAAVWFAVGRIPDTLDMKGIIFPGDGTVSVLSTGSGKIHDVRVSVGDMVDPHDILAVIPQPELAAEISQLKAAENPDETAIAQKQNEYAAATIIRSPVYGIVLETVHLGDIVGENQQIVSLAQVEEGTNSYEIICYVPADTARKLSVGMEVQACPSYVSREEYGYMVGYISSIGEYPVTDGDIDAAVGNKQYVQEILEEGNNIEVRVSIALDAESSSAGNSAEWSNPKGNALELSTGTVCDLLVVVSEQKPYELLLGS